MKRLLFALILSLALITSCSDKSTEPSEGERIGAVCNDGTRSSATGSGACSHHGGVDYWIYK